jgi:integrase
VIQSEPKIDDIVFASRSGQSIVGYRKMWLKLAKLGGLPADITPHALRHSFASLAADLGYNEPTIASLLGHKTHSITSRSCIPPMPCCWPQPMPWQIPP